MILPQKYKQFIDSINAFIPKSRIYTDELRTFAWGTDAGFYRITPKIIVRSKDESEVSRLLQTAHQLQLPVTFRAAGTSLSGQSVSDSILIVAGQNWEQYSIDNETEAITMQPGLIGQRVNDILAPRGRKLGPDPASIKSAMIGGIVMNNASGMNCGTHANSDKMIESARIVLADGTVLDTGDEDSRNSFMETHGHIVDGIMKLHDEIRANKELTDRILYKYSIKNVMGLNIRPFVAYDDPFDIITHLMVGSEGTLAFLSQVTMDTEREYPCKATAMLYFSDIKEAARAVVAMRKIVDDSGDTVVKSAELLDKISLASVNDTTGKDLTAVLTETKALNVEGLNMNMKRVEDCLKDFNTYVPVHFYTDPKDYAPFWAIRSGIFPQVGGARKPGTTCLIEDVAFHIDDLPEATADLQALLAKHHYDDACIYGHALEGNFHFIINQSFNTDDEVARYEGLMNDVVALVIDKYDGSLKAEHGTGRNMAPFVKKEWGETAFDIMKRIKQLFDAEDLLNPGVIFNDDPKCFIKNFKQLTLINENVDKCMECGFCEINCLSCGFTLSSRQRIVVAREMERLRITGEDPGRLEMLRKEYEYQGNETCAIDGLCSMSCPMSIKAGAVVLALRKEELPVGSCGYKRWHFVANHFSGIKTCLRGMLSIANGAHTVLGTSIMSSICRGLHHFGLPLWTPSMPKPYHSFDIKKREQSLEAIEQKTVEPIKVVYFPSCINQTFKLPKKSPVDKPLINEMEHLLLKAGCEIIYPENMQSLCCGTIWESKGMPNIADEKTAELEAALWKASDEGKYPVLCDQSPCLMRMRKKITKMKLYEPAEFIYTFLRDRLTFTQTDKAVALHITCSMRLMGLGDTLIALANLCSSNVLVPEEVGCCAFAGDRGFTHPELNAYALRKLRPQIEEKGIQIGYSNSRTCEIGLQTNSGIPYISIVYLVDECTKEKLNVEG